jgi:hypothetical protein
MILDTYDDIDIITNSTKINCKCKNNRLHPDWQSIIPNLINGSACPHKDCVNLKISDTNIERYGVKCTLQTKYARDKMIVCQADNKDAINNKRKATMLKNLGVEYALQSPDIQEKMQKSSYTYKDYITPSGKTVRIQGFENKALDELFLVYKEEDILTARKDIPIIEWICDGNKRRYFPDIFIISLNKFIEVKSTWTFEKQKEETLQKANACKKSGYQIDIWIYGKKDKNIINI